MTPEKFDRRFFLPCLAPRRSELVCEVSRARFRNLEKAFIFGRVVEESETVCRAQVLLQLRASVRWLT